MNKSEVWVHNDFPEVEKLVKEFRDKIWKLENKYADKQGQPVGQFECKIETNTYDGREADSEIFTRRSLIHRQLIITMKLYGHDEE